MLAQSRTLPRVCLAGPARSNPTLRLADGGLRSTLPLCLKLLETLCAAVWLTCGCKRKLIAKDAEHALLYKLVRGALRNTTIFAACRCCVALRASAAAVQRKGPAAWWHARTDSQCGDVLLPVTEGALAVPIAVVQPVADAYKKWWPRTAPPWEVRARAQEGGVLARQSGRLLCAVISNRSPSRRSDVS